MYFCKIFKNKIFSPFSVKITVTFHSYFSLYFLGMHLEGAGGGVLAKGKLIEDTFRLSFMTVCNPQSLLCE